MGDRTKTQIVTMAKRKAAKKDRQKKTAVQKQKLQTVSPRLDGNFLTSHSGFGDNEPTRNTKELRLKVWDWVEWALVNAPTPDPIYVYGLDLTQNFFGTPITTGGIDSTKNRVRSVSVEILTPPGPVLFGAADESDLIMVLASVPVIASDDGGSSLVGQSTTVIHPDVRRPWTKVAHWDFTEIFTNSQFLPVYFAADTETMELFRLTVVDAVSGNTLFAPTTSREGYKGPIQFRVCIELAAPITLVPNPRRFAGRANVFAGAGYSPIIAQDPSPTQYELVRMTNIV